MAMGHGFSMPATGPLCSIIAASGMRLPVLVTLLHCSIVACCLERGCAG